MSEYRETAQKRTVVQQLQRLLLDRYISSDAPPKETLVCEEVFVNESQIPQDVLLSVFHDLEVWENDLRQRMNEFRWRKDDKKLPFLKENGQKPPSAEAKKNGAEKKSKKRKKSEPVEEPTGDSAAGDKSE